MRNKLFYIAFIIILFAIGFFITRMGGDDIHLIKRSRILLGTVVEIQIRETDTKKAKTSIEKAFAEIKRIDDIFSTYNEDSPVWKLNHNQNPLINVDPEVISLMVLCDSINKISNGALDVGLNNLIEMWGFDQDNPSLPKGNEIINALIKSGWQNVHLTGKNLVKRENNVGLNFGAIAKGYAVEKMISVLKEYKINSALVNAGGEIKTFGSNWVIGIQHPRILNQIIERINSGEMSVATSGDYEKYFELNGKRYHHILNPETGYPADTLISVTVLNENCAIADALATAVFVLGPIAGSKLIEQLPNTELMMIDKQMNTIYSSGFKSFIFQQTQ